MSSVAPTPTRSRDGTAASLLNDEERARIRAKSAQFAPPTAAMPDGRRDLVGLSREELTDIMVEIGEKLSAPSSYGTGSTIRAPPISRA